MKTRNELSELLKKTSGLKNIYFRQPSKGMKYPCIKYDFIGQSTNHADNIKYMKRNQWSIMIIDENPDSEIPDKILNLPYCTLDRPPYQVDGLNHWPLTLYF